jgi:uncharacterized protein YegJ (DUF2314 family)
MKAAIQQARDTLPLFVKAYKSPTPTQTYFSIKARFPYGDDRNAEYMWISNLSLEESRFKGIMDNEPIYVNNIHLGDTVVVEMDDISDWMIIDNGRLLGGFTIHVLRNNMTDSEREQLDAELGFIMGDKPALP